MLVEIFVKDSNARRTLQVGCDLVLRHGTLTQALGRVLEAHARFASHREAVPTEGRWS